MPVVIKYPSHRSDRFEIGNIDGENCIKFFPTISDEVDYVPIHVLMDGDTITDKITGKKSFLYELVLPYKEGYTISTPRYSRIIHQLFNDYNWAALKSRILSNTYFATYGSVVCIKSELSDLIYPLMMLCVKRERLFDLPRTNPTPDLFCLLIDNKFQSDPEHAKVFRNVKRGYIDVMAAEMDVLYTNNLKRACYSPAKVPVPKFATIADMIDYTQQMNTIVEQVYI